MKKNILFILIFLSSKCVHGQVDKQEMCKIVHDSITNRGYYLFPETPPKYPDESTELMMAFIKNNVTLPRRAYESDERIFFAFIVETNGKLTFLKMLKPYDDEEIKNEIIKVVKKMPKWTPGTCKNKPVPSLFVLPMKFKLN